MLKECFHGGSVVENPPAMQEARIQSLDQEDPLEEELQPTPGFLSGKSHGQRSLVGHKESDMTEWACKHAVFKAFCYGEWGDVDNSVKECMIQQQIKNMHKEKMPWLSSEALGLCTFTAKVSLILNQGTKILQSTPNKGEKCVCVCIYI